MSVPLCKFYIRGSCRNGSSCRFLHSEHQVPRSNNRRYRSHDEYQEHHSNNQHYRSYDAYQEPHSNNLHFHSREYQEARSNNQHYRSHGEYQEPHSNNLHFHSREYQESRSNNQHYRSHGEYQEPHSNNQHYRSHDAYQEPRSNNQPYRSYDEYEEPHSNNQHYRSHDKYPVARSINQHNRSHDVNRSYNNHFKGKLPAGWINCPNECQEIIVNTFVAFKTPLDKSYDNRIPERRKRFNLETLVSSMLSKKVKLGLLIDLTNTDRYYNNFEVENMGCKYVKIPCAGHSQPPTAKEVGYFLEVCSRFRNENSYIGVHCTHGFNRTGFMIISFLIEVLGYHVLQAINVFAAARPPGIYRQYLIDELYKRYSNEEPLQVLEIPDWV